jgi:Flp pilus assembly protein TadG
MLSFGGIAGGRRNGGRRGNAIIEFSLLMPWYVLLFVGVYDMGFYAYSLIATQNAARVGAVLCSVSSATSTDQADACIYSVKQLKYLPNVSPTDTTCSASPLTVTATQPANGSCPDGNPCTTVSVEYVTPQLIPIPGVFPGQLTITRTVTMRLRS